MVVELEAVDRAANAEAGEPKTAFDGAAIARFQFTIGERFQRGSKAEIIGGGLLTACAARPSGKPCSKTVCNPIGALIAEGEFLDGRKKTE